MFRTSPAEDAYVAKHDARPPKISGAVPAVQAQMEYAFESRNLLREQRDLMVQQNALLARIADALESGQR